MDACYASLHLCSCKITLAQRLQRTRKRAYLITVYALRVAVMFFCCCKTKEWWCVRDNVFYTCVCLLGAEQIVSERSSEHKHAHEKKPRHGEERANYERVVIYTHAITGSTAYDRTPRIQCTGDMNMHLLPDGSLQEPWFFVPVLSARMLKRFYRLQFASVPSWIFQYHYRVRMTTSICEEKKTNEVQRTR